MFDYGTLSNWVCKAVADIAAFGGNTRRIDTKSEKYAIGQILANCHEQADIDYVQGFLKDNNPSEIPQENGKNPKRNKERIVRYDYNDFLYSDMDNLRDMDNLPKPKEESEVEMFFDKKGNIQRSIIRGENNRINEITKYKKIEEGVYILNSRKILSDGSVSEYVSRFEPEIRKTVTLDEVYKDKDGVIISEFHTLEDGSTVMKNLIEDGVYLVYVSGQGTSRTEYQDSEGNIIDRK